MGNKWESGEIRFRSDLRNNDSYRIGTFKATDASSRDIGLSARLKCIRCGELKNLSYCSNCDHYGYIAGTATDGVAGLFCTQCNSGFTHWKCTKCGTNNPVERSLEIEKEGCYIATSVYGDYNHPKVVVLRNFRDNTLKVTKLGRIFIGFYYFISPHLIDYVKKNKSMQKSSRYLLEIFLKIIKKRN